MFLVTGANGLLGSHLAEKLLADGYPVRGLVRKTSNLANIAHLKFPLVTGDVTDFPSLCAAVDGVQVVFHLASAVSDWGEGRLFRRVIVDGTLNLIRAAEEAKCRRIVFVSSATVYGFGRYGGAESSKTAMRYFPYVVCKERAEALIRSHTSVEYVVIRPGNIFGPRDRLFFSPICRALEKGYMGYISGGKALTCPSYVENVADAIVLAGTVPGAAGKTYAVTDGLKITWREFIEAIAGQLGTKSPSISIPQIIAEPVSVLMTTLYGGLGIRVSPPLTRYRVLNASTDYFPDILPARRELGYSPRVDFRESIRRSVQWYLSSKGRSPR